MTLVWLILVLVFGGVAALGAERIHARAPFAASGASLLAAAAILSSLALAGPDGAWYAQVSRPWIPALGASLHLAMDGIGLLMSALAIAVGAVAWTAARREIAERTGLFNLAFLWTLAGVVGVFVAFDLLLFFVAWEAILIPMVFLIALYGAEARRAAAMKFFLFTQISGLAMLASIVTLAVAHLRASGTLSFDYQALRELELPPELGLLVMLGFFVAFAVKLPGVPFHSWLPDAYTQAPTSVSILLAGILSKMGGYGLLRILLPFFPGAHGLRLVAMSLGALTILYGGTLALVQTDFKRVIAYSSIAHMGFVLFGAFAWTEIAVQGTVVQMLAHGLSISGMFLVAGIVCDRMGTRDLEAMGGIWTRAPRLGAIALFFVVATLGMPGLGNFLGEILILLGGFGVSPRWTACAGIGLILSAVYALSLMQRAFQGESPNPARAERMHDLRAGELLVFAPIMAVLVWLGVYAQPVLSVSAPATTALRAAGAIP